MFLAAHFSLEYGEDNAHDKKQKCCTWQLELQDARLRSLKEAQKNAKAPSQVQYSHIKSRRP